MTTFSIGHVPLIFKFIIPVPPFIGDTKSLDEAEKTLRVEHHTVGYKTTLARIHKVTTFAAAGVLTPNSFSSGTASPISKTGQSLSIISYPPAGHLRNAAIRARAPIGANVAIGTFCIYRPISHGSRPHSSLSAIHLKVRREMS